MVKVIDPEKFARVRQATPAIGPETARSNALDDTVYKAHSFSLTSQDLPLPSIARATLIGLGCKDVGRAEKIAWRVYFEFEGIRCFLEDRKFGPRFQIWLPDVCTEVEAAKVKVRFLRVLMSAIKLSETHVFGPAIKGEVDVGRVGMRNLAGTLRSTYLYFRESARLSFAGEGRLFPKPPAPSDSEEEYRRQNFMFDYNAQCARIREGSVNASAMVNAYFSYLEHYLMLALPFTDVDLRLVDLRRLFGDRWGAKFKTVLQIGQPGHGEAKVLYDRLLHISETYRNPMAHGGHDKQGSIVSVFFDDVGRIPLMLSGIEKTASFKMDPYEMETFDQVIGVFDRVDDLLEGPALGNARTWIGNGFDVKFDSKSRVSYRMLGTKFDRFVEREIEEWERAVNMDW
ncbi:hypothetical protein ACX3O0_06950 [Homoserinimonas sp. A447]